MLKQEVAALMVSEVVIEEVLFDPGLVLGEGAGASWGGSWVEISLLAVAAEVALDAAFADVECLSGFLEGDSFV